MARPGARILFVAVLVALVGCGPRPTVVVPAVFHWRNTGPMDHDDRKAIADHSIQRVYFKVLDIGWNPAHGAHPVSTVPIPPAWGGHRGAAGPWTEAVELLPAIYITNHAMAQLEPPEVDQLAANLLRKLRQIAPPKVQGVLLDCDWTPSTKDRFFRLAQAMQDSLDVPVVVTLRLHQYAHPEKTGVPPADRAMLMVYNVGQVGEPGTANSIFNQEEAAPYFRRHKPYPLPLDIALPAFSWGAHFRKGRFQGILQEAQIDQAASLGLLTGSWTGVMQVTREDNDRLPELHLGDEVRMERMTPAAIAEVAELARAAVNSDTTAVAFFEVGTRAFRSLSPAFVDSTCRTFGTRSARTDALPFPVSAPSSGP